MKPDQERVKHLISDTVALLCKNGLQFNKGLRIQGLLGITVDESEVFLIPINETCSTIIGLTNSGNRNSVYSQPLQQSITAGGKTDESTKSSSASKLSRLPRPASKFGRKFGRDAVLRRPKKKLPQLHEGSASMTNPKLERNTLDSTNTVHHTESSMQQNSNEGVRIKTEASDVIDIDRVPPKTYSDHRSSQGAYVHESLSNRSSSSVTPNTYSSYFQTSSGQQNALMSLESMDTYSASAVTGNNIAVVSSQPVRTVQFNQFGSNGHEVTSSSPVMQPTFWDATSTQTPSLFLTPVSGAQTTPPSRMESPRLQVDCGMAEAGGGGSSKERQRVVCPYAGCDKVFASRGHWQRHEQSVHCGIRVPCCIPGCDRSFTRTDKMREHVRRAHQPGPATEEDGGSARNSTAVAGNDSLINVVLSSLWAVDGADRLHQL